MLQIVPGETRSEAIDLDDDITAKISSFRRTIEKQSILVWGEHCTECAMPACYASCAFYTPRADLKCRRFQRGLVRVFPEGDRRLRAMSLCFGKWGKLEAAGVPVLVPPGRIAALERIDALVARSLSALPALRRLPSVLARHWDKRKARVFSTPERPAVADAFVLECVAKGSAPGALTISIRPPKPDGGYFQKHFVLTPGYNRIEIGVAEVSRFVDMGRENLFQIEPVGAWRDCELLVFTADFVAYKARVRKTPDQGSPPATVAPPNQQKCKCVVWDLDNTLWQGVLIEDGLDTLKLDSHAVDVIKALDGRGILHSIASKNNPEEAMKALEHFDLKDYFLAPQISWGPKSDAIRQIAKSLNIGEESLAFIDDQPFECAEVAASHPSVRLYTPKDIGTLPDRAEFDVPATEEAARRRQMYREEEQRQEILKDSGGAFVDFLKSCNLRLSISDLAPDNINRVFELSQRTNQLNYSGQRLSLNELLAISAGGDKSGYVLDCSDRFGDYGIIGFAVVTNSSFSVENFFMSCRVQGKKIDEAFFHWLLDRATRRGFDRVKVLFAPTAKNTPSRQALADMQFVPSTEAGYFMSPVFENFISAGVIDVRESPMPDPAEAALEIC